MTRLAPLVLLAACAESEPTWHQDVAPIVHARCVSCHTEGGVTPFRLDDYELVSTLGPQILDAVESGRMAPWLAQDTEECQPRLHWKDDLRVTDEELDLLRAWFEAGAPEGDPDRAAELPALPELTLSDPSLTLQFPEPYLVDGERDDFQCFVLDPGNTETVWVTGVQLLPGNEAVDHHGLVYVDFSGDSADLVEEGGRFDCFNPPSLPGFLMATWTPGAKPMVTPEGTGMPMFAGAKIIVQMHYHPTGEGPEPDQSELQLRWVEEAPEWEAAQVLIGNDGGMHGDGTGLQPGPDDVGEPEFVIPAGASEHVETMLYTQAVDIDFPLYSVGTHMHYVGVDMKIDLLNADPAPHEEEEECLIQTPAWDFNWQRVYDYDAPIDELPLISLGDSLRMRCTYDNSLDNPFVVDALEEQGLTEPHEVRLGEETMDEMCLGLYGILVPPGIISVLFGG